MRLILTIPHNEAAVALLKESRIFNVTAGLNSFGKQIDIITYKKDIGTSNKSAIQKILPVLNKLRSLFVNAFIASIKERNLKKLLSSTLQLQSFRSYCNDLAKELEPSADDDNPSKILALVKAKSINRDFKVFPVSSTDTESKLNYEKALWFTTQYGYFTSLRNGEFTTLVEQYNDEEKPLPHPAQIFSNAYMLMTEFVTLDEREFLSRDVTEKELEKEYSYKSFCDLSEREETIDERLWHRYFKKVEEIFISITSENAQPSDQLIQLTNLYEIIKSMSEEDRENFAIKMRGILDEDLLILIIQQFVGIATSLPEEGSLSQCSQITQDYVSEITQALNFCYAIIPEIERPNLNRARCVTPLIKAAIEENIESLETLNSGLTTYRESSLEKLGVNHESAALNEEVSEADDNITDHADRALATDHASHDLQIIRATQAPMASPIAIRVQLADKLIETANDSQRSVRQRVINIQSQLAENHESQDSGRTSLLSQCWNVLKRIGNAMKSLYYYNDEVERVAHFKKAANPEISADKEKMSFRFFQGAKAVGICSPPANLAQ